MTRISVVLLVATSLAACAPTIRPSQAPSNVRAELWSEPRDRHDLFHGAGGRDLAPPAHPRFVLEKRDPSGFSTTLDLRDSSGREWSAKLGPEAQSEVVASRIVWALGYHQPPSYFVPEFTIVEGGREQPAQVARLRPKVAWLDNEDTWSWHENPFVGTQAYRGLLVLMMVLNSTDLKNDNNTRYLSTRPGRHPRHWYVVKDLGATLGATGKWYPERNNVAEFEQEGFIEAVNGPKVDFVFGGRHQELLKDITVADVTWTCRRLSRLTNKQWDDAFRAGGYPVAVRQRYIAKIHEKIREGLALQRPRGAR